MMWIALGTTCSSATGCELRGAPSTSSSIVVRVPIIRQPEALVTPPLDTIPEGDDNPLDAQLVPDVVQIAGDTETIEYHAEIASRYAERGAYAWTVSVSDDRGNVVRTVGSGEGIIAQNGTATTAGLAAGGLADGFYALRIRAAFHAADSGSEDVTEVVQFLRVKGKKMREMTATDWYKSSNATLAVRVKEGGAR